jgi:hypothetical protein
VNVHPTKREVFFINEEPITARIADAIQAKLVAQSQTKTFQYQVGVPHPFCLSVIPHDMMTNLTIFLQMVVLDPFDWEYCRLKYEQGHKYAKGKGEIEKCNT